MSCNLDKEEPERKSPKSSSSSPLGTEVCVFILIVPSSGNKSFIFDDRLEEILCHEIEPFGEEVSIAYIELMCHEKRLGIAM